MRRTQIVPAARVLVTLAAVGMLGGCATKGDIRSLQTELRAVGARQDSLIAQLRRENRSTQDTLRETSDQLFAFRGDIARQLRDIAQILTRLEALTGENQRGIVQVRDQLANMRRSAAVTPAVSDSMAPSGGTGSMAPTGNAEDIFNAAVSQFNRGSMTTARSAFERFLQSYPNHRLAPDAHFFLADIMVQEDRIEDALEGFMEIQALFPTAAKVPDALYRVALLQIELDRRDEARRTLERIINTYPDAGVALLAREKLSEIR